jgi:predicted DnaQ family exonuclease/DinG family helicase
LADQIYVSLDLELIEAGSPQSKIIEIAAVRFDERHVLDEWVTLVNPGVPVPYAIRTLTGIDDKELAAAPTLERVAKELGSFVGDSPLVGQSIEIDIDHLQRQGVWLEVPLVDTFELGSLLLPGLPAYDLFSIARALDVPVDRAHRALADAHLAREVFLALLQRIRDLDLEILMHVNRLSLGFGWPFRDLFAEAERDKRRQLVGEALAGSTVMPLDLGLSHVLTPPETREEPLVPNAHTRRIEPAGLARELRAGGRVARTLERYEERPQQIEMLNAVCEAFNKGEHLIVEAGTGTGKSLAYLLPALSFAAANNRRVIISTNTINLQDQLYQKDVPGLVAAMDYRVRAMVLKGRTNYLCLHRWVNLLRAESMTQQEAMLLIKTLLWVTQTATGDRSELRLTPEEEVIWSRVCSQAETCSPVTCPYHRNGSCFIARARRAAEASHVVIVNHALLLSDLATKSRVVPDYEHLVIDEAHHLENEATNQLGYMLTYRSLSAPLEALAASSGRESLGAAHAAVGLLRTGGLAPRRVSQLSELAQTIHDHAGAALTAVGALFDATREFIQSQASGTEPVRSVRLTRSARHNGHWSVVEQRSEELRGHLNAITDSMGPILDDLGDAAKEGSQPVADMLAELLAIGFQIETMLQQVPAIITKPSADAVCWVTQPATAPPGFGVLELSGQSPPPTLHFAPLDVAPSLKSWLLDAKATTVFTSATLTTDGSFEYIRERLGATEIKELALGSPFDYERAALLLLPNDIPEPNQPGYARKCAEAIVDVAEALGGRTLVLFTSYAQLRATHEMIKERIDRAQIALMSQGVDGSRTRLLQRFKTTERALLLGTASFWEGVDVVGEALSALVIARLPFAVPSDPIFAARSEQFDDPFRQYAVPQSILRFKQGFGRLIRSVTGIRPPDPQRHRPGRRGRARSTGALEVVRRGVPEFAPRLFGASGPHRGDG